MPWKAKIPAFLCPSDGLTTGGTDNSLGRCSYHFSNGDYFGWWGDPTTRGPFEVWSLYPDWPNWYQGGVKELSAITDGTSNTIAITERGIPGPGTEGTIKTAVATNQSTAVNYSGTSSPIACLALRGGGNRYASGVATGNWGQGNYSYGWQGRNAEVSTVMPPNAPSCSVYAEDWNSVMWAATSYHPGGVNAVFLDGSVRFISDTIDTGNLALPRYPAAPRPTEYGGAFGSRTVASPQLAISSLQDIGWPRTAFGSGCWCRPLYLGWAHLAI